ncbi:MAG: hypothetical protein ACYS0E_03555 [Planctomycetota bacterium]|jgi:hypothetical protein
MSERVAPAPSRGLLGDIYHFLLRRPARSTHVVIQDAAGREHYGRRIARHLGTPVDEYSVLNIHRIGINATADQVMDAIRNGAALDACWPNHLARVERNGTAEARVSVLGCRFWSLFRLTEIEVDPVEGEARHLLFRSHGGYPIGIFAMFVRPSIRELNEEASSQFFFVVSFNFYGRPHGWVARFVHGIWEAIHNRATGNILNRFRKTCEGSA